MLYIVFKLLEMRILDFNSVNSILFFLSIFSDFPGRFPTQDITNVRKIVIDLGTANELLHVKKSVNKHPLT